MPSPQNVDFIEFDPVGWIKQFIAILFNRKKEILIFFFSAMVLVVVGLLVCPRSYISDSKLFVRIGRESVALDPTATTGQTLQLYQTRESEITSVMDLLKTRGLYDQVVARIGEDIILGDAPFNEQAWKEKRETTSLESSNSKNLPLGTTTKKREKAIKELLSAITPDREEESSVITVSAFAGSPELARAILTEFIDIFQTHHFEANRTSGSHHFFEEQTSEIRSQYIAASEKLRDIREDLGSVSIYTRRETIQQQIDSLEHERISAVTSLEGSKAMIASLNVAISKLPENRISESVTGLPDDAIGTLRREINLLAIREAELLSFFTENHPSVAAVQLRRQEAEKVLRTASQTPGQVKQAIDPAWQEMQVKLLYEQTNASSLTAQIAAIDQSLHKIREQLNSMNSQEAEMINLEQNIELLRQKLGNYAERIEEARIEEAMATSGISNVNIVQPPSLILKAASPRKGICLVIGFFFAFTGAVSFAFLREVFENSAPLYEFESPATTSHEVSFEQHRNTPTNNPIYKERSEEVRS